MPSFGSGTDFVPTRGKAQAGRAKGALCRAPMAGTTAKAAATGCPAPCRSSQVKPPTVRTVDGATPLRVGVAAGAAAGVGGKRSDALGGRAGWARCQGCLSRAGRLLGHPAAPVRHWTGVASDAAAVDERTHEARGSVGAALLCGVEAVVAALRLGAARGRALLAVGRAHGDDGRRRRGSPGRRRRPCPEWWRRRRVGGSAVDAECAVGDAALTERVDASFAAHVEAWGAGQGGRSSRREKRLQGTGGAAPGAEAAASSSRLHCARLLTRLARAQVGGGLAVLSRHHLAGR